MSRGRALVAALALLGGCGYRLAARGGPLAGGVTTVFVPPFENRTGDADAGALLAASVREELARRDAASAAQGGPRLEGVVEETRATPSATDARGGAAAWRLALVASARLVRDGKEVARARVAREEEFLGGQDALETEGRRRLALRRAAATAARDLLEQLEAP